MQVKRFRRGDYIITLHGHSFSLIKPDGGSFWVLTNAKDAEITCAETKSGLLELMKDWSLERTTHVANLT